MGHLNSSLVPKVHYTPPVRHKDGGVCPQNQNMHLENECNDLKTPLEVDILASKKQNYVSYITKKPKINMVCGLKLQNKESERYHIINTLNGYSGICSQKILLLFQLVVIYSQSR